MGMAGPPHQPHAQSLQIQGPMVLTNARLARGLLNTLAAQPPADLTRNVTQFLNYVNYQVRAPARVTRASCVSHGIVFDSGKVARGVGAGRRASHVPSVSSVELFLIPEMQLEASGVSPEVPVDSAASFPTAFHKNWLAKCVSILECTLLRQEWKNRIASLAAQFAFVFAKPLRMSQASV